MNKVKVSLVLDLKICNLVSSHNVPEACKTDSQATLVINPNAV